MIDSGHVFYLPPRGATDLLPAMSQEHLPIDGILPLLRQTLSVNHAVVLQAPPGAGKTTHVPLALLDEAWLAGRSILMLEPRRLAARAACARMAQLRGETAGETVGYRFRDNHLRRWRMKPQSFPNSVPLFTSVLPNP